MAASVPALAIAVVALACGTGSGNGSGRSMVELQSGLSVGNPPEWYTEKLDELGYRVASLRYDRSDRLEYRVEKDASEFVVRVTLDPEQGTGSRVEIEPASGALVPTDSAAGDDMSTPAATAADSAADGADEDPGTGSGTVASSQAETNGQAPVDGSTATAATSGASPRIVGVPGGTRIATRLNDYLDSGVAQVGDRFTMTVSEPVRVAGVEAIPAGSLVHGVVAAAESARRPNKGGRLVLKAERIDARGQRVSVEALVTAETRELEGEGSIEQDLKEIAIGAGVGGLVGGLLGGGKGVLAGILIGGGGTFAATKGEQVELPPDTPLVVELRQDASFSLPR